MENLEILTAQNPRWGDAAHTIVDIDITTSIHGDEVLPFTATAYDVEEHGRKLFNEIMDGKYGAIAEYVQLTPIDLPAAYELTLEDLLKGK